MPLLQHSYDQLLYRLTDRLSPVNEALWSPVDHKLMGRGHMFRDGCVAIPGPVPSMNGNPVAFYTTARVDVNMTFGTENLALNDAMAFYEPMVLNTRPTRFEDRIRKIISRRISR